MKAITKILLTFSLVFSVSITSADEIMCINFSAPEIENSSCDQNNGRIKLNHDGTAPFIYAWSHDTSLNDSVAENLPPGTYQVTVTDNAGCSSDITIVILEKSFNLSGSTTQDTCGAPNGSATVNVVAGSGGTAPFTYLWNNNAGNQTTQTAINLSNGIYQVTVTDADGCDASLNLNVSTTTNGFGASISDIVGASCYDGNDGSATVRGIGGTGLYSYEWFLPSDPNTVLGTDSTLSGVPGERYIVRVRDPDGSECLFNVAALIPSPDSLRANLQVNEAAACRQADGFALVIPSGGTVPYSYSWSNGSTNDSILNLLSGRYTVFVTDSNNCVTEEPFWLTNSTGPFFHVDTLQEDNCGLEEGIAGIVIETGKSPFTVLWGTNNPQNSDTSFFAYNIRGVNFSPYSVTVIDADSCLQVKRFGMPGNEPLAEESSVLIDNYCELSNGSATVNFSGGTLPYSYEWTTNPSQITPTATGLNAGVYEVTVTDSFLCTLTAIVEIDDEPGFTIATSSTDESCYDVEDGSASVSVSGHKGSITYEWNSSPAQFTETAINLPGGAYNVVVRDSEGCERKGFEVLDTEGFIQADFTYLPDTMGPVVLNQEYQFINRSEGGDIYTWDFGDGNMSSERSPFHVYADTGRYFVTLTVTDSSGICMDEQTYGPFIIAIDGVVHVPNAFTPNGDGFNDFLVIQGQLVQDFRLNIYNRWGREVFVSESINDSWDGRLKSGKFAPEGVYVFVLEATVPGNNPILQKGTITVLH